MIQGLKIHLQKLLENSENGTNVCTIIRTLNKEVYNRFQDYEKLPLIGKAMILDPRQEKGFSDNIAMKVTAKG